MRRPYTPPPQEPWPSDNLGPPFLKAVACLISIFIFATACGLPALR